MKNIISILSLVLFICGCTSKTEKKIMIGLVNFVAGSVYIISVEGKETSAVAGIPVDSGMKIRTKGENSLCEIYIDENIVKIFGNTELSIDSLTHDKNTGVEKTHLSLNKGRSFFRIKNRLMKEQEFSVKTSTCTAAVRGTEFFITDKGKSSTVACLEGRVQVESVSRKNTVDAEENEQVIATGDSRLVKSNLKQKQTDTLRKDSEVKPASDNNLKTFGNIEKGDATTLTAIRKKLKRLRTPAEIKKKQSEPENDEESGEYRIDLPFYKLK